LNSAKSKKPTMRDVAARVGVSIQTVSAVINEKPGITLETRERVFHAIHELNYRTFTVARSLRTRQTHTVALIVPDIANPSFSTIASAAENVAQSSGYSLVNYNTHADPEREANYIRTIAERWVDGVLFISALDQMTSHDSLQEAGIPCVAIDRIPQSYSGPSVTLDNVLAGRMAAEHLIDLGHQNIAHISGPLYLRLASERKSGYLSALEQHGLPDGQVVSSNGWSCEEGYTAFNELIASNPIPTAVFAASDRLAIGAMLAASQAGLRIPEDISFIGLDDIEVAAYLIPPLTTVRQSFTELATLGMKLLLSLLNNQKPENIRLVIEPELIIRCSTARVAPSS
jgi:DNA-binding LacI/PurR family transcriptional regulator